MRPRRRRAALAAAALAAPLAAAAAWTLWLPDVRPLKAAPPRTTAYIELRRRQAADAGRRLDLRWEWVPLELVAKPLRDAVVAAEDGSFWRHDGVDWDAVKEALDKDLSERRLAAGGSTITMQLARNLYLSPSKNPLRKLKEVLIARRLERELGKRRILELYVNTAEWGRGIFGCEAAAKAYFAKPCAELSGEEAAALAAVLPNPRRWDPSRPGPHVSRSSRRIMQRLLTSGLWEGAPPPWWRPAQSSSTSVSTSTGEDETDQGRNPDTLE